MKESTEKRRKGDLRSNWSLVINMNREIFLPLECHHFLRTDFGTSSKNEGRNSSRMRVSRRCRSRIRGLYVVDTDIADFDILGFELSADACTVESSA